MKKTMLAAVAILALLCGATPSAHATYDGVPSTGSFTVVDVTKLAAANAYGSLVVIDTTGALGSRVTLGPYVLVEGRDWRVGATSMTAAISLTAAINANDNIPVDAAYALGDASILLTAISPGTLYNSFGLKSSTPTALSVSGTTLGRGQDNAVVKINAVPLVIGRDWFAADVATNTSTSLVTAINNNPILGRQVQAVALGAQAYLRSSVSPVLYTLSTSNSAAVTVSNPTMTGGSAGNLNLTGCFLGFVDALPTANYPQGCIAYLNSDATHLYLSTETVVGVQSWLAK